MQVADDLTSQSAVERIRAARAPGRPAWEQPQLFSEETSALGDFVSSLAHRIAGFPAAGHVAVKDRVNTIALAPAEDFRRDSDLFGEGVRDPEAQSRIRAVMKRGFQTRDAELALARMVGDLADH